MFKIKFDNNDIRSCSRLQVGNINKDEFDNLLAALGSIFIYKRIHVVVSEGYETELFTKYTGLPIGNILFYFKPLNNINKTKFSHLKKNEEESKLLDNIDKSKQNPLYRFQYNGYTIPSSMDLSIWENIKFHNNFETAFSKFTIMSNNNEIETGFFIKINDFAYNVDVLSNDVLCFSFIDESLNHNKDLSTFKRTILEGDREIIYFFENGKVIFHTEEIKTKYIKPINKDRIDLSKPKILALDLETKGEQVINPKNNKHALALYPIVMSIFDGGSCEKPVSFVFNKKNWESAIINAFKSIMKRKYNGYTIYTHNFSYFDAIFLIDTLSKLGKVYPFMRDKKILKLTFKFRLPNSKREYVLYFMDSLLMLPDSLDKLSNSFNTENKKLKFPIEFLNETNVDISYRGDVPDYSFFAKQYDNYKYEDYLEYLKMFKNKKWSLKNELVKYCENDTIALYQVLIKFREYIYSRFGIDFIKYPTIPSLSFAIYRSNFLKDGVIPIISSKLHKLLKQSYFGGITEVYTPLGKNIKSYDINSLYPHSMKYFPMPTGQPRYVNGCLGDIQKYLNIKREIPYGIFKVKVKAPENLDKPFLPARRKTKNGIRTIFPIGKWTGWYFSEEIKNAMQHGYRFEFIEGYLFNKTLLFDDFINVLYLIKTSVDESDPWYYIAKLIMNSLYGRFGLNPEGVMVFIVSKEESSKIIDSNIVVDVIELLSGNMMITCEMDEDEFSNMNISVPISSAIAAYSRMTMSYYLTKYSKHMYYIDTDGIKIDTNLEDSEIDPKELGKMKYEYELKKFVSLGPKTYGGILTKPYKKYKKEIVKVKGYRSMITLDVLDKARNRHNKIQLDQQKWTRKLSESTILITDEKYTVSISEGKREIVYNPWGDLVGTFPIKINENEIELNRPTPAHLIYLKNPILYFV